MALNMLKAEPTKISVPMKQKRCMMKTGFLSKSWLLDLSQWLNPNHSCGRPAFRYIEAEAVPSLRY
ncbi:hypothetical protein [Aeromonas fluvialis]|uniref:hypothetical protein n=1 Tax=Aeromonas fluvialis TaxID=591962 RepID=UPI0012ECD66D